MAARRAAAAAISAVLLGSCAGPPASPTPFASATPITLPGPEALVPPGVASTTSWREMASLPDGFDATAGYDTPSALADAFAAAIAAGYAGSPERPDLALEELGVTADRATLLMSETGVGDDSVAGSQYALVAARGPDGWTLEQLWTRALCRRGGDAELCI